jgi:beta-mannanase
MHLMGITRKFAAGLAATIVLMTYPGVTSAANESARAADEPPAAVALGVYRPEFPNDMRSVTYLEMAGAKIAIVHWYAQWGGWKSAFNAADVRLVSDRGYLPMLTWEPWAGVAADPAWSLRSAILSGQNDAYIDRWAHGLSEYGLPVLLRFAHEMHDQTYPWAIGINGNTPSDYVDAWRHVRAIFARYKTDNVKWIWNPNTMGTTVASDYLPIYRGLYPGDDLVDWIGLDIFNTGPSVNWGAPYWRTFDDLLSEPYKAITAVSSRPLILPEIGTAELGGSKSEWTARAMSPQLLASFPRLKAMVWFDVNKEAPWALDSTQPPLQTWISAASQPLFHLTASQLTAG